MPCLHVMPTRNVCVRAVPACQCRETTVLLVSLWLPRLYCTHCCCLDNSRMAAKEILLGHADSVYTICVASDQCFFSGSEDGTVTRLPFPTPRRSAGRAPPTRAHGSSSRLLAALRIAFLLSHLLAALRILFSSHRVCWLHRR